MQYFFYNNSDSKRTNITYPLSTYRYLIKPTIDSNATINSKTLFKIYRGIRAWQIKHKGKREKEKHIKKRKKRSLRE